MKNTKEIKNIRNNFFSDSDLKDYDETNSFLTDRQILLINQPTPEEETELKTESDGFKHRSVKASYVKMKLSLIFGWNFNFNILEKEFIRETNQTLVLGRLTIKSEDGRSIIREQFGKHNTATNKKGSRFYPVNIGDAYKAAASDSLKKCASELGLFWDVYGVDIEEPEEKESLTESKEPQSYEDLTNEEQKHFDRLFHFLKNAGNEEQVNAVFEEWKKGKKIYAIHTELYEARLEQV